jgi:hypothetical protein
MTLRTPAAVNTPDADKLAAFEAAVSSPNFAYTRAKSWRADGWVENKWDYIVYVYHRNPTSPTGVTCEGSLSNIDEADRLLAKHGRPSPLSPTEGLNKSGATG